MKLNDYIIGHIRTLVPVAVGAAATWLASRYNIVIDDDTTASVIAAVTSLATAVYYIIVRAVAVWIPAAGVLLGVNKAPDYEMG